jgi:hypothetical protein
LTPFILRALMAKKNAWGGAMEFGYCTLGDNHYEYATREPATKERICRELQDLR